MTTIEADNGANPSSTNPELVSFFQHPCGKAFKEAEEPNAVDFRFGAEIDLIRDDQFMNLVLSDTSALFRDEDHPAIKSLVTQKLNNAACYALLRIVLHGGLISRM